VEPEAMAIAREWPTNTFPWQQTRDATMKELLEMALSIGPVLKLYKEN
jgi:hypothetical protein